MVYMNQLIRGSQSLDEKGPTVLVSLILKLRLSREIKSLPHGYETST